MLPSVHRVHRRSSTSPEGLGEGFWLGWTLSSLDGLVEGSALGVSLGCKLEASGSLLGAARLGS
jgi:hypothetical protein